MARDFDGIDDVITGTVVALDSNWTMAAWIRPDTVGETAGRIFDFGSGSQQNVSLQSTTKLSGFQEISGGVGTDALSISVDGTISFGGWQCVFATYTAADKTVRLYVGDLDTAVTEVSYGTQTPGDGTTQLTSTTARIGNNSSGARTFDGRITRPVLSRFVWRLDEMEMFRLGIYPSAGLAQRLHSLVAELNSPTASVAYDLSGRDVALTVSGTAVAEDPPIPMSWGGGPIVVRVQGAVTHEGAAALTGTGDLSATPAAGSIVEWESDFEEANSQEWQTQLSQTQRAGSSVSFQTSSPAPYEGTYYAKCTVAAGAGIAYARFVKDDFTLYEGDDIYFGFAIYLYPGFYANQNGQVRIGGAFDNFGTTETNPSRFGFWIDSGDTWKVYRHRDGIEQVTILDLGSQWIPEGEWHYIDCRYKLHRTAGQAVTTVWLDGEQVATSTAANISSGTVFPFNRYRGGLGDASLVTNTISIGVDDFYHSASLRSSVGAAALTGAGSIVAAGEVEVFGAIALTGTGSQTASGSVLGQAQTPAFRAAGTPATSATGLSITPGLPTHLEFDILVCAVAVGDISCSISLPAGWEEIDFIDGTFGISTAWWWKRAGPAETDPLVTITGGSGCSMAAIYSFANCTTTDPPFEDATAQPEHVNSDPTSADVLALDSDRLAVCFLSIEDDTGWTASPPPIDWSLRSDLTTSSGTDMRLAVIDRRVPEAGAVSDVQMGHLSAVEAWTSLTLLLIPGDAPVGAAAMTGAGDLTAAGLLTALGEAHLSSAVGSLTASGEVARYVRPLRGSPEVSLRWAPSTEAGGSPAWEIISDRLREAHVRLYRSTELDEVESGTATFVLSNSDRELEPLFAGSASYPNVVPRKMIELRAITDTAARVRFTGFIRSWQVVWPGEGVDSIVVVQATDMSLVLNRALVTLNGFPEELVHQRIHRVLDAVGIPPEERDVSDSDSPVAAVDDLLLDESNLRVVGALEHCRQAARSDGGYFFISRVGHATFHNRTHRRDVLGTPLGTFGDGEGEMPYATNLVAGLDDSRLWNRAAVITAGGTREEFFDADSAATFWESRRDDFTSLLARPADAATLASLMVWRHSAPTLVVPSITAVIDTNLAGVDQATVLAAELGTRFEIIRRPPGGGDPIQQEVHVEGITEDVVVGRGWTVTFDVSQAESDLTGFVAGTDALDDGPGVLVQ